MKPSPPESTPAKEHDDTIQIAGGIFLGIAPFLLGWLWLTSKSYYSPLAEFFGELNIVATTIVLALAFHAIMTIFLVRKRHTVAVKWLWLVYPVLILLLFGSRAMLR